MITDKMQMLAAARAKVAELERAISADLNHELAALPSQYGFENAAAFIAAVRKAARGRVNGRRGARHAGAAGRNAPKKRTRAKITEETRKEVKKLVEGGKTAREVANIVGISEPSVANIKKALGLTRQRK